MMQKMSSPSTSQRVDVVTQRQGLRVQGVRTMRLPWRVDAANISAAVDQAQQLPQHLWRTHFNNGRHDGGWQALALRAVPQAALDIMPMDVDAQQFADCEALQACPAIHAILRDLDLPFKSVRLMQLLPGSEILEHTDAGLCAANGDARLHIPLQSDEQVYFHIAGERLPMHVGECWYTDVSLPHRVRNRSGQARIHLVMDVSVDQRMAYAFKSGDAGDISADDKDPWSAFERFREAVFSNAALADELVECGDLKSLCARSVELGSEMDLRFDASDVESAMKAGRKAWTQQWTL